MDNRVTDPWHHSYKLRRIAGGLDGTRAMLVSRKKVSKCFSMALHIRSHRAPCSCFLEKVSLQLSSEQSVGDVWIAQLDRKRVARLKKLCRRNCRVFAECSRHHASRSVSWPQRAPSAVGHEAAVVCQVERRTRHLGQSMMSDDDDDNDS